MPLGGHKEGKVYTGHWGIRRESGKRGCERTLKDRGLLQAKMERGTS